MIEYARASDREELARLYRRNHPDIQGRLETEVQHESQTFVARDGDGSIIGLALVTRVSGLCGGVQVVEQDVWE